MKQSQTDVGLQDRDSRIDFASELPFRKRGVGLRAREVPGSQEIVRGGIVLVAANRGLQRAQVFDCVRENVGGGERGSAVVICLCGFAKLFAAIPPEVEDERMILRQNRAGFRLVGTYGRIIAGKNFEGATIESQTTVLSGNVQDTVRIGG